MTWKPGHRTNQSLSNLPSAPAGGTAGTASAADHLAPRRFGTVHVSRRSSNAGMLNRLPLWDYRFSMPVS